MNSEPRKQFLWGMALAYAPWAVTAIGLGYAFRGISNSKATGLMAVAGGFAEGLVMWGIAAMIVTQITAVVLLARSLPNGGWVRGLFSVLSIGMSVLMLIFVAGFLTGTWHAH